MNQLWKTERLNQLHQRELFRQAEQERLTILAQQNTAAQSSLQALSRRLVAFFTNLRPAQSDTAARAYKKAEMVVDNN